MHGTDAEAVGALAGDRTAQLNNGIKRGCLPSGGWGVVGKSGRSRIWPALARIW